jgi:ribA/ribD-fused uncharacterized protein
MPTRSLADVVEALGKMEGGVKLLTDSINDIKADIKSLKESMNSVTSTNDALDTKITGISQRFERLEQTVQFTEQKYNKLNANYKLLCERIIHLESQSRRDNLLIDGLPESATKESNEACVALVRRVFREKLELLNTDQIRIVRCHRLGPPPSTSSSLGPQTRPRTVIVKFHWFADRQAVWQARTKLKRTGVFLSEDFPKEIVERRKTLTPVMYAAKDKNLEAYLVVDKLHIKFPDGHKVFDVNSLSKLPQELDPKFICTAKTENVLSFFGSLCPLSNFHPSPFVCEGRQFRWVEEYFFHKKAELGGDQVSMKKIAEATSPAQCKGIGRYVKCDRLKWQKDEVAVMKKALHEKFSQNPDLRLFLLNTGTLHLAEASPTDKFWGTGVGLGKEGVTDQTKWHGKNMLGQLLMDLRTQFT